jgi:hypothetical protein
MFVRQSQLGSGLLLVRNFFMTDMQAGIGPGVFLQAQGWTSGLIGTALTLGNVAGMLMSTPIGGCIDARNYKRTWVIVFGIGVVLASVIILFSQEFWAVAGSQSRHRSQVQRSCPPLPASRSEWSSRKASTGRTAVTRQGCEYSGTDRLHGPRQRSQINVTAGVENEPTSARSNQKRPQRWRVLRPSEVWCRGGVDTD